MKKNALFVTLVVLLFGLIGCQSLTPEQQKAADKAQAEMLAATAVLNTIQTTVQGYIDEYTTIKAKIDAGESIPATVVSRFAQLTQLIAQSNTNVQDAIAKVQAAKKAYDEAIAAGVAWYNNIPWQGIGGALLSLLALYFPVLRPLATMAQVGVQATTAVASVDPDAGQKLKDAMLKASRDLGVETKFDALVQKYDPPSA